MSVTTETYAPILALTSPVTSFSWLLDTKIPLNKLLKIKAENSAKFLSENPVMTLLAADKLTWKEVTDFFQNHIKSNDDLKRCVELLNHGLIDELNLEDSILSPEDVKLLAEFIKSNKTCERIILPRVLIYDPREINELVQAILTNKFISEVSGLFVEDDKAYNEHLIKNRNKKHANKTIIKDRHLCNGIKANDPKIESVSISDPAFKHDLSRQLELISALAKNMHVNSVNVAVDAIDVKEPKTIIALAYALEKTEL